MIELLIALIMLAASYQEYIPCQVIENPPDPVYVHYRPVKLGIPEGDIMIMDGEIKLEVMPVK